MSQFITGKSDSPRLVHAVAYHGFLWDAKTHMPLIDPEKYDGLSATRRADVDQSLYDYVPHSVGDLLQLAKRITCERNTANDKQAYIEVNRFLRKAFHKPSTLIKTRVLKACAQTEPPKIPVVTRLALGINEFTAEEVAAFRARSTFLTRIGRNDLAQLLDLPRYPAREPADVLETAQEWYGMRNVSRLRIMADMFGSQEAVMDFAHRRAAWKGVDVGAELRQLQGMNCPRISRINSDHWVRRIKKQMNFPYEEETDLMQAYPRFHVIQRFISEKGINLASAEPEQLLTAGEKVRYEQGDAHPDIAKICSDRGLTEEAFKRAVRVMNSASDADLIPDIHIDGRLYGLPDTEVVKLDKRDPMILCAGVDAKCCGHIGGSRKKMPMTKAMVTHPDVGCYVVRDKESRAIRAKLGVWMSKLHDDGRYDFVVNAWHAADAPVNLAGKSILRLMAEDICARDPNISRVLIGRLGEKFKYPVAQPAADLRDPALATKDTRTQFVILRRLPPQLSAA